MEAGALFLCLDSSLKAKMSLKNGGDLVFCRDLGKLKSLELRSSFVDSRQDWRLSAGLVSRNFRKRGKNRKLMIVDVLGGQYEDNFEDVKKDKFTMHKSVDGKRFILLLCKEQHELAERVMITRLHLHGKWIKKCNHGDIHIEISEENLELMRERLMETVIWTSDDTTTEKIG